MDDFDRAFEHELRMRHAALDQWSIDPQLLARISDERNLALAWGEASQGGQSAGISQRTYESYSQDERWSLLRTLRTAIRAGTYRRRPLRRIKVPKPNGGERRLALMEVEDRVVARGVVRLLGPLLDPLQSEFSFAWRAKRGTSHAIATLLSSLGQGRQFVVANDIRTAFDRVPRGRLGDVVRRRLPNDVAELLDEVSRDGPRRGIIQGAPTSPMLLNLYLDHFLDRPWRDDSTQLLRYADDLLVTCRDELESNDAAARLVQLARSAGMPLHQPAQSSIRDLREQDVEWLGYRIRLSADGGPVVGLADDAWRSLEAGLAECHSRPDSPLRADDVVRGWLCYLGPCHSHEDQHAVCRRVRELAEEQAFDELIDEAEMLTIWRIAADRFRDVCRNIDRDVGTTSV